MMLPGLNIPLRWMKTIHFIALILLAICSLVFFSFSLSIFFENGFWEKQDQIMACFFWGVLLGTIFFRMTISFKRMW
ncbi:hypothetical protein C0584_04635 [Candidatus Parcubacteria bacterium]|nr:MAG: hypothetical protein C0584_04635 [Candidatus Parcubacteria bacterium]